MGELVTLTPALRREIARRWRYASVARYELRMIGHPQALSRMLFSQVAAYTGALVTIHENVADELLPRISPLGRLIHVVQRVMDGRDMFVFRMRLIRGGRLECGDIAVSPLQASIARYGRFQDADDDLTKLAGKDEMRKRGY